MAEGSAIEYDKIKKFSTIEYLSLMKYIITKSIKKVANGR